VALALLLAGLSVDRSHAGGEPWPPVVMQEDQGAPELSAEDSLKTIVVPPGYRVELVAKEPLVQDPILIDFDADGRMWVVEMPAFAMGETMQDSREGLCRVVVLEDLDDDGAVDRRTVFADKLVLPRALKTLAAGVLVGEPPHLWRMRDTNGDLRMDEKELVSDSYGRLEGNPEHNANSLIWGLDNWIYTSEHDWHLRFRRGGFEVMPTLNRGQWGGSIDDAGRVYRNVNNAPLFVDFTPARYFMRNTNVVETRGLYFPLISLERAEVWPVRPSRGINRGYRDQVFREDGTSRIMHCAATPVVFRGDRLPAELRGGVFVTDCTTNLLHWFAIDDDGRGRLSARNGFPKGEIFASRDERLRPVNAASAPDGTLYVVDMYRGVVQDAAYQTEYLKDYIRRNQLAQPVNRGRIWRLVHEAFRRDRKPALSKEPAEGLVAYLSHPNGWWRDTAQQLLVQRGDRSVVPALQELVRGAPDWRTRLHALGTLGGLEALDAPTLQALYSDPSADVRAWALRWSEPWLAEPGHPLAAAALRLMDDPHWTTRRQLAASLGELPAAVRAEPAASMLRRYGDDPITVDAVVSGLAGMEAAVLGRLLQGEADAGTAEGIATLTGALARSRTLAALMPLLDQAAAGGVPLWQRTALLRGLDAGLTEGRPGELANPGRPAPPRASLSLEAAPAKLLDLTSEPGDIGTLARAVAARLDWPDKPAAHVEVPSLTAVEKTRFETGRSLYANLCVACHGPDGRGRERLAPSLVGSPLVMGDPGVPTRVLLAGKEGDVALMPPVAGLTDDDIASVLTYLRREWGHTASAVQPDAVKEIRGLTKLRTRPWTSEELRRLAAPLAAPAPTQPLRVFIRAGEKTHNPVSNGLHDYPAFLADWSKILLERGVEVDGALHFPTADELARTDVLVIYKGDGGTCSSQERAALETYLQRGGGLVVLHDGMCSNDPAWFAQVAGGAKRHGEPNYSPGQLAVRIVDREHPITRGLRDFQIDDEAFFMLSRTPGMHVLLEAALPKNGEVHPQAWSYERTLPGGQPYRSFVWMQGHYPANFQKDVPRELLLRGLAWAGKRPAEALLAVTQAPAPRD
jgi:mono/diheme cytochrome c family protein/glucose/arabinose dehydrogenase/type 1 glutamine amidotransferase